MRHNSTNDILLVDSLDGYDDHIDYLTCLFEELQLCCVEAANYQDVLEFTTSALYVGLIDRQQQAPNPPSEANNNEIVADTNDEDTKAPVVNSSIEEVVAPLKPKKHRRRKNKKHQADKDQTASHGGNIANQSRSKASNPFSGSTKTLVTPTPISFGKDSWLEDTSDSDTSSTNASVFVSGSSKEIINGRNEWTKNWAMEPILTKSEDPDDSSSFKISPFSPYTYAQRKFVPPAPYKSQSWDSQTDWNVPALPKEPLGLIYLFSTPHHPSLEVVGEVRLGIILHEKYRGYGYAQQAVQLVVEYAFEELNCHRIQATLLQTPLKAHALKLFTRERFGHEGTRRGAFFSPLEHEWKDTTTMAMLDVEWVIRSSLRGAPPTLWDEMFLRHERERDILLRWEQSGIEEERRLLRRTSSMETIRYQTSPSSSDPKGKTKAVDLEDFAADQDYLAAAEDEDEDFQFDEEEDRHDAKRPKFGGASSTPRAFRSSTASPARGLARAPIPPTTPSQLPFGQVHDEDGSSSESSWDAMETSSNSSFDNLSDVF
ncbi:hypothetical protein IW261DRAFT_1025507 [Armillaria novae-zelandiae]|uniref:N-acetyltransferase domain-containing protein n=1 Tax=Armillaria novae-zelandiae TaxID=153914 RepID=A0AA39UD29_9AGAR|nr:hypothetical protein IW261DRAFT_1025507 [Armillaria novae-zelandiae]